MLRQVHEAPGRALSAAGGVAAPEVDAAVRRAVALRLLGDSRFAEWGHALLGALVALYFAALHLLPEWPLLAWALTLNGAALVRMTFQRHAVVSGLTATAIRRGVRRRVVFLALAWGVGAAICAADLAFQHVALLLVVMSGLVSASLVSLLADRPAFLGFLIGTLGPLPVGILAAGRDPDRVATAGLIVLFGVFLAYLHRLTHAAFLAHQRTQVLLAQSEAEGRRQRAQLDALIASAPIAIVWLDATGHVLGLNTRFTALFGWDASEVAGRALDDLITPVEQREAAHTLQSQVLAGESVSAEVERCRKDGTLVPVRVFAARVEAGGTAEEAGEAALFVMYEDITLQLAAQQALQDGRDAAERAVVARTAFLATMSHEIRTPLNGVMGMTDLLLDSDLTPEQRRAAELVQSSGQALLHLLNDILDFSKLESDRVELEAISFDLHNLVESIAQLQMPRAIRKGVELHCDIKADVPRFVRGDPGRLRQILMNLVTNAIKFTETGDVVITMEPAAADAVRFSVRDTGIGIPAAKLDAIFDDFTQADSSTTRKYGGTGLGLAIVRRIVHAMGGEIAVRSVEGEGSDFHFTIGLPAETAPAGAVQVTETELSGRRVAIVDDSHTNRRIVRGLLEEVGLIVDEAADAEAGLALLRAGAAAGRPYALAVLDGQMPGTDGFTLASTIRADPALEGLRLLMLTSAGVPGDAKRCRERGIEGYLVKPASRRDLVEAVAAVLRPGGVAAGEGLVTRHSLEETRRRLRILLAEDNAVNQEVATALLTKRGHTVHVVGDGREAIAAAAAQQFDVVLMDLMMPELDGFEALRGIRALPGGETVPVVALTAHAMPGERERCLSGGMDGYLAKPFAAAALFAEVERWSGRGGREPPSHAGPEDNAEAAVDVEGFRRLMASAGAREAADDILETFLREGPVRLAAVQAAATSDDATAIEHSAHAFRSSASAIGAKRLAALLQTIEYAGHTGSVPEAKTAAAGLAGELEAALTAIRASIGRPS